MPVRAILTAIAALSLSAAGYTAGDVVDDAASPQITIESASPEWTRRVEWGLQRFQDAGLRLPPVAISVHQTDTLCQGNSGLYSDDEVHLCSPADPESRTAKLITLHELAHAWAETQLSVVDRDAFLGLRDLDVWVDRGVPPHEWGAEHAAEVVSWGLMDEMPNIVRIYHAEPAELSVAYDMLVGAVPLWSASAGATAAL